MKFITNWLFFWKGNYLFLFGLRSGLFIFFLSFFFQGCAMAESRLIKEIHSIDNIERFKSVNISSIVLKYIPIGASKDVAIRELAAQGVDIREEKRKLPGCNDCDDMIILGSYIKKSFVPLAPDVSYISIAIGLKENRVALVAASYTKNSF